MNKLIVRKDVTGYTIYCDDFIVYYSVALQAVIDWLEETFAPPIKVTWKVDARSKQEVK